MNKGYKAFGASFVTVGSTGCKLSEFKLSGVPDGNKTVTIQTLDSYGEKAVKYYYHQNESGRGAKANGWWIEDKTQVTAENDVIFKAGDGLWVSGLADVGVTTSGEVLMSSVPKELRKGYTMLSNPYPTSIKLSDIEMTGVPDGNKTVTIQTLDSYGEKAVKYYYHQNESGRGAKANGWWVEDKTQVTADNDVLFPAGTGLWVSGLDGVTMTFKFPQ